MSGSGAASRETGPLVVVGLDAFEVDWLHRWSGEGRLPFLTTLMKQGVFARVRSMSFPETPWTTLVSGVTAGDHGMYSRVQLERGTYRVARIDARHSRRLPFWHRFRHNGLRLALLDVPTTFPLAGLQGIQVCGWGEHEPWLRAPESRPPEAAPDLLARFGAYAHPALANDSSRGSLDGCARAMRDNIERKAAAVEYLLGIGHWDFVFTVFSEIHAASHRFLHFVDEGHWAFDAGAPRDVREALPDAAERIDAALTRIHERLPAKANLIVVSAHGIEANFSANTVVPEFLRRLGVLVPVAPDGSSNALTALRERTRRLAERIPSSVRDAIRTRLPTVHDHAVARAFEKSIDWRRTQVFMLPGDGCQAYLSLNLAGREPGGIVEPGSDAEAVFGRVRAEFMRLVNADTGRPAVDDVHWVPALYPGAAVSELPDMVVHWSKDVPIRTLRHPELGVLDATEEVRAAQHMGRGFLLAIGPAFAGRVIAPEIDAIDFAPTLLHLLGEAPDPDLPGRPRLDLLAGASAAGPPDGLEAGEGAGRI